MTSSMCVVSFHFQKPHFSTHIVFPVWFFFWYFLRLFSILKLNISGQISNIYDCNALAAQRANTANCEMNSVLPASTYMVALEIIQHRACSHTHIICYAAKHQKAFVHIIHLNNWPINVLKSFFNHYNQINVPRYIWSVLPHHIVYVEHI